MAWMLMKDDESMCFKQMGNMIGPIIVPQGEYDLCVKLRDHLIRANECELTIFNTDERDGECFANHLVAARDAGANTCFIFRGFSTDGQEKYTVRQIPGSS